MMSNYPGGFEAGVLIRELPFFNPNGKDFYVGNHATPLVGEKGVSNNNKGTFLSPFSTWDYAVEKVVAGRGDRVWFRPSTTSSVIAAAGIDLDDCDGAAFISTGFGEDRHIVTFSTAAAASLHLDADNVWIEGFLFKNDIDQQTHMIDCGSASTTAKDCVISHCEFREGSSKEALSFITSDAADNASDRMKILNCRFYAPTAGDADNAIHLGKDFNGVRIKGCDFYGDWDEAAIEVPAGGNAQVDLIIQDCNITNLLSTGYGVKINGTANTGSVINTRVFTSSAANAVDAGGLETYNVIYPAGETLAGSANEEKSVVVTGVDLASGDVADVLTVAGGPVIITMLAVKVTTAVSANAALIHFESDPTVGASNTPISASSCAPDIASAAVGDWFAVTGDSAAVAVKYANGTALPDSATNALGIVVDAGGIDLKLSTANPTTGAGTLYCRYKPLAPGAYVTA